MTGAADGMISPVFDPLAVVFTNRELRLEIRPYCGGGLKEDEGFHGRAEYRAIG
jgi:hypothetical protein